MNYYIKVFNQEYELIAEREISQLTYNKIFNLPNNIKRRGKFKIVGLDKINENIIWNNNAEVEKTTGINHKIFTPYKLWI
jgi:hypothetical protein